MSRQDSAFVNSLCAWQLNSSGESIPMVHDRVLRLLEIINPGKWGQDVLDLLMSEGWVKCTVYGSYELTRAGLKERKKLPEIPFPDPEPKNQKSKDVVPWKTFRKLVAYYADCVKHQERSQQYLFSGDCGRKYMHPVLPYGWLKELGEESAEISIRKEKTDIVAINTILTRRSYEEEVYIGYPLEAFYHNGNTHYVPIALIPVDVRVDESRLYMTLRLDEADINHVWLEYHVNKEDHRVLLDMLTSLHPDDEYCGLIDVKRSLPYLERYARGCSPGMFDPNSFDWNVPHLQEKGDRAWNCPALFVGTELKYSRTLLRELRYIAKEKDEVLDSTALAYVFREPVLKPEKQYSNYAHPFIETNDEQQLAVSHALNNPVTLVTGPPGTGKSQVAVNIIANCVLRGNPVLFTSRNHKAVHAIADRSMKLLKDYGTDLVNFCSTPDGQATDEWFKKDVNVILSRLDQLQHASNQWSYEDVYNLEKRWCAVVQRLGARDELETELSKIQARVEELEVQLRRALNVRDRVNQVQFPSIKELQLIVTSLADAPRGKGLLAFCKEFMWRLNGCKRDLQAREKLSTIMPSKVNDALPSSHIKDEVERFIQKLKDYFDLCDTKEVIEQQCKNLLPIEAARECLQDEAISVTDKLIPALLFSMSDAARPFLEDEEMLKQLVNLQSSFKSQSALFQTQGVNSETVQDAVIKFKRWLKIAPAWATTMLSLTRSAPCLPAVYDTVIIDEASQCDVPPMIPALYRAKSAVIVGDPQQFPPVVTMREARNEYLLRQNQLKDAKYAMYNYCQSSAYSVVGEKRIMLTNHYRCHPDIAEYFNEAFYNNRLNVCTAMEGLCSPSAYGLRYAVDWVNVNNSIELEIGAVVDRVALLARNGYSGTVGVVTPLRKYANILDEKLNRYRHAFKDELIVNTVNAFQGGEKDVIIFMLSYTSELSKTQNWYLTSESNRYIYNVAVSRARACLVLVGDKSRCAESGCTLLRKLAALPIEKTKNPEAPRFDSVWEERFYRALVQDGIIPQTQYHLVGRRLDIAVITDSVKLDIEVDGVRWHTSASGGRKTDDLWRDIQVTSAGWKVLRFWVYQLEQDMQACVDTVKNALK